MTAPAPGSGVRPICVAVLTLFGLTACSKFESSQDEMSWARAALQRNDRLEVVASDTQAHTFTVRLKDTGALRMVRADQVIAGPPGVAAGLQASQQSPQSQTASEAPGASVGHDTGAGQPAVQQMAAPDASARSEPRSAAAAGPDNGATSSADEPATAEDSQRHAQPAASATPATSEQPQGPHVETSAAGPGHLLASGPGYSIKAGDSRAATSGRRANGVAPSGSVERMHDPIICQGERFLQIDNRNIEFDGDAVSAQDGCEIHITNSRIAAKGVGVLARKANVHIENSEIDGDLGSVDASDGAQVYSASSTFKGLRRRMDDAAFHDLGGNVWN